MIEELKRQIKTMKQTKVHKTKSKKGKSKSRR